MATPIHGTGREVHGVVPLLDAWLAETVISASQPTVIPPTEACLYVATDTNASHDGEALLGDMYYGIDDTILDVGCLSVYQVTRVDICVIQGAISIAPLGCVSAQFTVQPGSMAGTQIWHLGLPSLVEISNTSLEPACLLLDASYSLDTVWILATSLPNFKGELRECGNQYAIAWYSNPDITDISDAYRILCDIADVPSCLEHSEDNRGGNISPTYMERTFDQ